jgi:hypothetical protein
MKEEILNVLSWLAPLGIVVATILDKPAAGCVLFAIGFVAVLEAIDDNKRI